MADPQRPSQIAKQVSYVSSDVRYFTRKYLDALSAPGSSKALVFVMEFLECAVKVRFWPLYLRLLVVK